MNLQNGYKVIYEVTADGTRTFYATKGNTCDPAVDAKIVEAEIGKYRLIYEKDGRFYGSESGIPADGDFCFEGFNKVFVKGYVEPVCEHIYVDGACTVCGEVEPEVEGEPSEEPVEEPTPVEEPEVEPVVEE